jgi:predicted esterase
MRVRLGLLWLAALAAPAQDAALVLSTSVTYGTMMAATAMAPERMDRVAKLRQDAMIASRAGNHGEALRHLHHGMALMQGLEWTPTVSRASSLAVKATHAVWEPGQAVRIRFAPMYASEGTNPAPVVATIALRPAAGPVMRLKRYRVNRSSLETTVVAPKVPAGRYVLEVTVSPVPQPKTVSIAVETGVRKRVAKLRSRVARLKVREGPGLWTALYAIELFQKADRSVLDPAVYDFDRELTWGEQVASALEKKRDPFAGRVGDLRRAYRSTVDKTLQPYRLYVPSAYRPEQQFPLVVALHGMGGDENMIFDSYASRVLQEQAERHGYFVAAPKGRGPASMFREDAERDVMDVLAEVRAAYRIDPKRIYLMGHSMGGYGTWSIAMDHPDVFAALAPVSGGGNSTGIEKIKHIPQFVVHGEDDRQVPVRLARLMVEAAKSCGSAVTYLEVKGGGHVDVFVPSIPKMFEFFNGHAKARRGPS